MKILNCPLNGPRNISEFVWGGEVKPGADPATATDAQWTEYLFLESNIAGEIHEWWLHAPTNYLVHRAAQHGDRDRARDDDGRHLLRAPGRRAGHERGAMLRAPRRPRHGDC